MVHEKTALLLGNKWAEQTIRQTVATELMKTFLPLIIATLTLSVISDSFNLHTIQERIPGFIALATVLGLFVIHKRGSSLLAARIAIGLFILLLILMTVSWNSFRTVGILLGTSVVLIWCSFFTSRAFTIGYLVFIIVLNTALAIAILHGVVIEKHLPSPVSGLIYSHISYIVIVVSMLTPVKILFDSVAISRRDQEQLLSALNTLKESRSFTIQAVDNSHQLFGWLTPQGELQFANETALKMVQVSLDSVTGKLFWETPWFTDPDEQEKVRVAIEQAANGESVRYDTFHCNSAGDTREIDLLIQPTFDLSGSVTMIVAEGIDVTNERNAQRKQEKLTEQLHQSQKMEAVGQLAGGVAHDFNNALCGIMGAAELLKSDDLSPDESREYVDLILTAGDRAANLTKKLLLFSRKGSKVNSVMNCAKIVEDTASLLKHTIHKNITVTVENRAIQTAVIGDDSLLQNAIINMGINASHAMPNGGELTFSLENLELDAEYCEVSPFEIFPGEYLEISIRDTGTGMPPEILSRIFEPFFTTKELGKGTGLGMAAVYGTVQEHNGAITVYSEVGAGTVFHIYLPVTTETVRREITSEPIVTGSGTILVIDDEELIRITASAMLRTMGYRVILATNGQEGVNTFAETKDEIDLIILDMIMPVMGGREAFAKLREIYQNIPILIASGFAKEKDMAELKKQGVNGILNKPFRKAELAEMVKNAIHVTARTMKK